MSEEAELAKSKARELSLAYLGVIQQRLIRPFEVRPRMDTSVLAPFVDTIYSTLYENVLSCLSMATIAFDLCLEFEQESFFRSTLAAERIRQLAKAAGEGQIKFELDDEMHSEALRIASEKAASLAKEADTYIERTVSRLLAVLDRDGFQTRVDNLTRQSIVLLWTAFETFNRDLLRAILNARPDLYRRLEKDQDFRKEIRSIDIERIAERGFDLSNCLGDIIFSSRDLSNAKSIERIYLPLYPEAKMLHCALSSKRLYFLGKVRNLIVHTGGVVDSEFLKVTDYNGSTGDRLKFHTVEFQEFCEEVLSTSEQVCNAVKVDFTRHP